MDRFSGGNPPELPCVSVRMVDDKHPAPMALLRAAEHPLRMQEMQPIARVNGYGESAIEYVLFLWIRPKDYMDVYYDVMEAVKREFDAAGIEMTYPHINVHNVT